MLKVIYCLAEHIYYKGARRTERSELTNTSKNYYAMSNLHQCHSGFVQYISFAELIARAISVHVLLSLLRGNYSPSFFGNIAKLPQLLKIPIPAGATVPGNMLLNNARPFTDGWVFAY